MNCSYCNRTLEKEYYRHPDEKKLYCHSCFEQFIADPDFEEALPYFQKIELTEGG